MPATENSINLTFQLKSGENVDPEELDRETRELLSEIREMDIESAELVKAGELPEGAKAGEPITLGTLSVAVLPAMAPILIEFVQSWSLRAKNRIVKIKAQVAERYIELEYSPTTMSTDEIKRLVSALSEALPEAGSAQTSVS
jgi:hypothetical protein